MSIIANFMTLYAITLSNYMKFCPKFCAMFKLKLYTLHNAQVCQISCGKLFKTAEITLPSQLTNRVCNGTITTIIYQSYNGRCAPLKEPFKQNISELCEPLQHIYHNKKLIVMLLVITAFSQHGFVCILPN